MPVLPDISKEHMLTVKHILTVQIEEKYLNMNFQDF